jgi:excinuclease UvrABC ATPase subunit
VIGVDWGLVIPDEKKTLRNGAIKTIQTPAWKEQQDDLMRTPTPASRATRAWNMLTEPQRKWVIERLAELERQLAQAVVRRQALLRVPRIEGVQDAHPRAAVEVPQLHASARYATARA